MRTSTPFSRPTRFSEDPKIGPALAHKHKMKILGHYFGKDPRFFARASNEAGELLGFQVSFPESNRARLYEIIVSPEGRSGFVAAALLAYNLRLLASELPAMGAITTGIYESNLPSLRFFERLGMRRSAKRHYHYHGWLTNG